MGFEKSTNMMRDGNGTQTSRSANLFRASGAVLSKFQNSLASSKQTKRTEPARDRRALVTTDQAGQLQRARPSRAEPAECLLQDQTERCATTLRAHLPHRPLDHCIIMQLQGVSLSSRRLHEGTSALDRRPVCVARAAVARTATRNGHKNQLSRPIQSRPTDGFVWPPELIFRETSTSEAGLPAPPIHIA